MAWLFSKALLDSVSSPSSLVPAVASSAVICSDGEPSAPSSSTPTPQAYLWPDRTTGAWRRFPSGMTCERLTADRGEAVLMSFLAGFRARTSASRGRERGLTASALVCGRSSLESLARFDRASSSWKTPQLSLVAGLDEFSETWPRSGSMRSGTCWERETSAPHTDATESGLWLPTPCTVDGGSLFNRSASAGAATRPTLGAMARFNMWPTPLARDHKGPDGRAASLPAHVEILRLPTPTKHDHKSEWSTRDTLSKRAGSSKDQNGGKLNPTWVEWLMGWPLEWTDLRPLETDKFQQWQRSHSELFSSDCEAA